MYQEVAPYPLSLKWFLHEARGVLLFGGCQKNERQKGGHKLQKLMIFIDGMNLLKAWKYTCSEKGLDRRTRWDAIKLQQILSVLRLDRNLVQTRYYSSTIPRRDAEHMGYLKTVDPKGFHDLLERKGFKCIIRKNRVRYEDCPLCQQRFPKVKEKGVDVSIAIDMAVMGLEDLFDVAILVSGDADFIPVVELLRNRKKIVEVAQFQNAISWNLRRAANSVFELDDHLEGLILKR